MNTEQRFADLVEEMRRRAAEIPCGILEYISGLGLMIEELEMAREAAEADLKQQNAEYAGGGVSARDHPG